MGSLYLLWYCKLQVFHILDRTTPEYKTKITCVSLHIVTTYTTHRHFVI